MSASPAFFYTRLKVGQQSRADIHQKLRSFFIPSGRSLHISPAPIEEFFARQENQSVDAPAGKSSTFHPLDTVFYVDESEEDGICRVCFKDGSWVVLFHEQQKIIIYHSAEDAGEDAEIFAAEAAKAARWSGKNGRGPDIRFAGRCGESGPLIVNTTPDVIRLSLAGQQRKNKPVPIALINQKGQLLDVTPRKEKLTLKKALYQMMGVAVPFLSGIAIGMGVKFGLAASVTTMVGALGVAPVLVPLISAVALGAVAGGATKFVVTALWGGKKKEEKFWWLKAMAWGAGLGAVGGAIGFGIGELLTPDISTPTPIAAPPVDQALVVPPDATPLAPTPLSPIAPIAPVEPSAPLVVPAPLPVTAADLVPSDLFNELPTHIQKLASTNPLRFCKEASYWFMNATHHDPLALQTGAKLIHQGLDIATQGDMHSRIVEQLYADAAYVDGNGVGTHTDIPSALNSAQQAGRAVHNYGGRFLRLHHGPSYN